tara:strand:+ start:27 stop:188 length:162 start_codon:yes stop_codon:yes gene_type:complete
MKEIPFKRWEEFSRCRELNVAVRVWDCVLIGMQKRKISPIKRPFRVGLNLLMI